MNYSRLGLLLFWLGWTSACAQEDAVRQVGRLQDRDLKESSGLVSSRTQPGVLWTHNDGGGRKRQVLYAINRSGAVLATFAVAGLTLSDWEDIAVDDQGNLYVGDLGNNGAKRDRLYVYRVREPDVRGPRVVLRPEASWELRFPAHPFDCESLFVHESFAYVISKVFDDQPAELYRFPLKVQEGAVVVLEQVARLPVTSPVTGADLTANSRLLGLVSKSWAYVFEVNGDLAGAAQASYVRARTPNKDVEGCCFVADGLLATAESREIVLFAGPKFVP